MIMIIGVTVITVVALISLIFAGPEASAIIQTVTLGTGVIITLYRLGAVQAVAEKGVRQSAVNSVFLLRRGRIEAEEKGLMNPDGSVRPDIQLMYEPIIKALRSACDQEWNGFSAAELFVEIEDRWGKSFLVPSICTPLGVHQNACIAVALRLVRPELIPLLFVLPLAQTIS